VFFEVHRCWEEVDIDDEPLLRYTFEPTDRDELERLINGDYAVAEIEIVDHQALTEPPEAETEEEPSATIYFRLPPSLKNRVETLAKEAGLSTNAWMMRCVERCIGPQVVS
jgi:predicted HicB family RNase H-like nuclease